MMGRTGVEEVRERAQQQVGDFKEIRAMLVAWVESERRVGIEQFNQ